MIGFQLNGTTYYYVRNLQGDVTKIINTSGTVYATYTYDAWGKCTVGTNTSGIADKNPIRYRGYYYDVETGFYYLNSRYYDPEAGRFISPDVVAEGGNLYAYCLNDPINRTDSSGNLSTKWKKFFTVVAVVALVVAVVALTVSTCGAGTAVLAGGIGAAVGIGGAAAGTAFTVATIATGVGVATTAVLAADAIRSAIEEKKSVAKTASRELPSEDTIIYRYGGKNPGNLTPKQKDAATGLSFSTVYQPGAAMTTIGELNKTGVVYAVQDGATHVSVKPVAVDVQVWIDEGPNSIWTQAVKSALIG